jgi:hypothetical protein
MVVIQPSYAGRRQDGSQQFTNRAVLLKRMPEVGAGVDKVGISASIFLAPKDPGLSKVSDDSLRAPLSDADLIRHIAKRGFR